MKKKAILFIIPILTALYFQTAGQAISDPGHLAQEFTHPPKEAWPKTYWWWLHGNIDTIRIREEIAQMDKMGQGFCENPGSGGLGDWAEGDTSRPGNGSGGPGQGDGVSPDAKETSITFNDSKANVNTQQGPIIGSRLVYEGQIRGESRTEFAMGAKSAAHNASDAIESMLVPREFEGPVMKYFGALEKRAETAEDAGGGSDSSGE